MDAGRNGATCRAWPDIAPGSTSVRSTVETAARIHIPALTLYAFSEENWKKRPTSEVGFLMRLSKPLSEGRSSHAEQEQYPLWNTLAGSTNCLRDVQERMAWAREATVAQLRDGADPGAELQRAQRTGGRVPFDR